MNNDDATVQADSRMRSSLYAAKLVVSAPLWNGRFFIRYGRNFYQPP